MSLFGRRCVVYIDTLRVEGLDVSFSAELDAKTFGKAKIEIFNLNSDNRRRLEDSKSVQVELLVGYEGQALDRLFLGTLRDVFSAGKPPDWITTLRTGDGDKAGAARINRSYNAGTALKQMWEDVINSFSEIKPGNAIKAFRDSASPEEGIAEVLNSNVLQGSALKAARRMARRANLDIAIQDNEFVVTPIGAALATTAIVLSPDTGLIGSPEKGVKGQLKVKALIVPGLRPKRQIEIKSRQVQGVYVVEQAKYTGNTAGNDWYADLVCKEL